MVSLRDERLVNSVCTNNELLDKVLQDIGTKLRNERYRQNMEISALSTLAGVNPSAIYRYERNERKINLPTLIKISTALNLDISEIISIHITPKEKEFGQKFNYIVQNQSYENIELILKITENIVNICKNRKRSLTLFFNFFSQLEQLINK